MTTATAPITPPPQPAPARMTAEEFGIRHAGDHVEYINGKVREIPMAGGKHGKICNWVAFYLMQHVVANDLGHMFINDTFVKVPTKDDPERVYGPDVCFISYDRLAKGAEVPAGILPVIPDLVIEVRSPFDTWTQVFTKIVDYLAAGVPIAVFIDPATRSASVCGEPFGQRMFGPADTLTLPEVLPGFSVPVAKFFE
jgi:Uma2 family endonuclease